MPCCASDDQVARRSTGSTRDRDGAHFCCCSAGRTLSALTVLHTCPACLASQCFRGIKAYLPALVSRGAICLQTRCSKQALHPRNDVPRGDRRVGLRRRGAFASLSTTRVDTTLPFNPATTLCCVESRVSVSDVEVFVHETRLNTLTTLSLNVQASVK